MKRVLPILFAALALAATSERLWAQMPGHGEGMMGPSRAPEGFGRSTAGLAAAMPTREIVLKDKAVFELTAAPALDLLCTTAQPRIQEGGYCPKYACSNLLNMQD